MQDEGIIELLNNLDYITFTEYDEKSKFAAIVYKIRHEANGNRVTFIKALEGTLKVRDEITYRGDISEKISSVKAKGTDAKKSTVVKNVDFEEVKEEGNYGTINLDNEDR